MGNKRFSTTTYVLVGISLVALYFVGKSVTPPPPAPTPEAPPQVASVKPPVQTPPDANKANKMAEDGAKQAAQQRAEAMRRQVLERNKHKPVVDETKKFNPIAIQTTADYWHENHMGKKGEAEMDVKVAEAKKTMKPRSEVPIPAPASKLQSDPSP